MNRNGDEKRIRQLFRDLSLDEQRQAPQFVSVLARANSRATRAGDRLWSWRSATAVAVVCAALLIAMIFIVKPSKPQGSTDDVKQAAVPKRLEDEPRVLPWQPQPPPSSVDPHKTTIKPVRRRHSNQVALTTTSLFAWKSPTASLLQTPDDELMKSLPRLGESLKSIKQISPEQFN